MIFIHKTDGAIGCGGAAYNPFGQTVCGTEGNHNGFL